MGVYSMSMLGGTGKSPQKLGKILEIGTRDFFDRYERNNITMRKNGKVYGADGLGNNFQVTRTVDGYVLAVGVCLNGVRDAILKDTQRCFDEHKNHIDNVLCLDLFEDVTDYDGRGGDRPILYRVNSNVEFPTYMIERI